MSAFSSTVRPDSRPLVAQGLVALLGLVHVATGVGLLFAPLWFFTNVGTFPPFNRHYAGDLGAFQLALGFGLLVAARDPRRHRLLIGVAALGNLVHIFNHAYDAVIDGATMGRWLADIGPLALVTAALWLATSRYIVGERE